MPLEDLKRAQKLIVGTKETLKALEDGRARLVFIARDANRDVIGPVLEMASRDQIQVAYVDCMRTLGKACGIEVGAATAAIPTGKE